MHKYKEGRVTSWDGSYYRIVVEGDDLSPFYLTPLELGQGIKIGDLVKLEYRSSPRRGYWHATILKEEEAP